MCSVTVITKGKTSVKGCVDYVYAGLKLLWVEGIQHHGHLLIRRVSQVGRMLKLQGKEESTRHCGIKAVEPHTPRAALRVWGEIQKYSKSKSGAYILLSDSLSCLTWGSQTSITDKSEGLIEQVFSLRVTALGNIWWVEWDHWVAAPWTEILLCKSCSNGWGLGCFLWDRCWEWGGNETQQN